MTDCTHHWTVTSPCPFCQKAELETLRTELTMSRLTIEDGLRTAMTRSLTEWNEYVRRANSAIIHIDALLAKRDKP